MATRGKRSQSPGRSDQAYTSVPLTQGSEGRHDGDSDGLPGLPGLDREDETTGYSVSHAQVTEPKVQQVLAVRHPFLYQSQNSLVVLGLFLETMETAQEHHQLHICGTPEHCTVSKAAYLWKIGPCHPKDLCHVPETGGSTYNPAL